jgi:hypothetical protein
VISGFPRHVNDICSLLLQVILAISIGNLNIKIAYLHLLPGPEEIINIIIITIIFIIEFLTSGLQLGNIHLSWDIIIIIIIIAIIIQESIILKKWTTPDFRNTPSATNLEEEEIVHALGNHGNFSMPEQIDRSNPRRKIIIIIIIIL